jgi:tetratricopeptide (TPR) repeat protein
MAIKGSLREASLPDVLQLLSLGQKSGCLSVTDRSSFGYIYFDRGNVCYASIVNRRDRLGDLLVKNGLVDADVLAAAVESQGTRAANRLGEILVEQGAVSRDQLERHIRAQIEEAVYHLFTWTQGSFYFEADQRPEEGALLVSINPEGLLLEGARRVDEWSLIEKKIPSLDLIFALDPETDELERAELTTEQRKILPLLDGSHSVGEMVDESGLVEFEVGKALFGLIQAGYAHPRGRKRARPAGPAAATRIQEHHNLGLAFYRTGMLEEAAQEFHHLLELDPESLDARFYLALVALRAGRARAAVRWLKDLVERGGRWGAAFHNLALALEILGRPDDAILALDEAAALLPRDPRVLLSRAVLLVKTRRFSDAAASFDEYRTHLGPNARPAASYFAFAPLAEAARGDLTRAEQVARAGVEAYPHVATVLLHAGCIRERSGAWDDAEILLRRAIDADPGLAQARKSLGDVLYRRGLHAEAAEQYDRAVELAPELGDDVYFKLGNLRYREGDRPAAVLLWGRALELNPAHAIAATNLELVQRTLTGSQE